MYTVELKYMQYGSFFQSFVFKYAVNVYKNVCQVNRYIAVVSKTKILLD